MFWFCSKIVPFWKQIFSWYCNVYDVQLEPDVVFVLLGCSESFFTLPCHMQKTIRFGTLVAKRLILNEWKSTNPPILSKWLREKVSGIYLERICRNSSIGIPSVELDSTWGPITEYINSLAVLSVCLHMH